MSCQLDARKETFEEVTVFGKPMLFTCARIDRRTVPKGMFSYDVRHDDECQGIPYEITPYVLVNHWGTLITNRRIELHPYKPRWTPYRIIEKNDWNYEGVTTTLGEYMKKHPPYKEQELER